MEWKCMTETHLVVAFISSFSLNSLKHSVLLCFKIYCQRFGCFFQVSSVSHLQNPKYNNCARTPEFRTSWFRSPPTLWCLGRFISVLTSPSLLHNASAYVCLIWSFLTFVLLLRCFLNFLKMFFTRWIALPLGHLCRPLGPLGRSRQTTMMERSRLIALVLKKRNGGPRYTNTKPTTGASVGHLGLLPQIGPP